MPDVGGIAGDRLKSFIERIERLEEEKRVLAEDIKEVYAEAKGTGFDTKIIRQIIRIRKRDQDELDEEESLLKVYMRALGMLPEAGPQAARRVGDAPGCGTRDYPAARAEAGLRCRRNAPTRASASASVASKRQTKRAKVALRR